MKSKKITKNILPIVITSSLAVLGGNELLNNDVAYAAEVKISDGFVIGKPLLEGGSVKFTISVPSGKSVFNDYWSKVERVLIDGKDFGFNNKGTSSRDHYSLYEGEVTGNASGLTSHFEKRDNHKIEFIFNDGSKAEYIDENYTGIDNVLDTKKEEYVLKEAKVETDWKNRKSLTIELENGEKHEEFKKNITGIKVNGKDLAAEQLATGEVSRWLGIRYFNEEVVNLLKDSDNKFEITLKDGTVLHYPKTAEQPKEQPTATPIEEKYKIKEAKQGTNWKNEKSLTIELIDGKKTQEFYDNITGIKLNGTDIAKELLTTDEVSAWQGIRYFNSEIVKFLKDTDNVVEVTLKDGTKVSYPEGTEVPVSQKQPEDAKEEPKKEESKRPGLDAIVITEAKKNDYEEVAFTLADGIKAADLYKELTSITINGKNYSAKDNFSTNWKGELYSLGIAPATDIYKSWNEEKKNTVILNYKDGTQSKEFSFGEYKVAEKTTYTTADTLPDGEYTLGFNALYADGRAGTSMLEGFFDKNVKLEVKDGEMKISMLNLLFAYSLYDFAIENEGVMTSTTKEYFGSKNSAGHYDKAIFTSKINKLEDVHLAGVIVGHMGGLQSQKGDFDKYTKVKLRFKPEITKGWEGYDFVNTEAKDKAASDDLLNKKLIANGVDTNKDGKVTAEELQNFEGNIDLGSLEIDGAIDKGKIYNIELLKNMGPKVKSFTTNSNELGELPVDLFKNATGLEYISLGGNKITKLPADLFANNKNLKRLNLSSNNLVTLPANLLANNSMLEELSIDNAWLNEVPADLFKNLTNLKQLSLSNNKLTTLAADIFGNNKNLEFLNVEDNNLTTLPESIAELTNLKGLGLKNNNLTSLPTGLGNLTKLARIDANNNHLMALADDVWANLARNQGRLYLVNNAITNIPADVVKANGQLTILDIANNYLPQDITYIDKDVALLGLRPEATQSYYPQKTAAVLNVTAKDDKIIVSSADEKATILNLFHWYNGRSTYYGGEGILQGSAKYKEFISKLNMPLADILKSDVYARNWQISTKIEVLRGGQTIEIYNGTTSNEDDKTLELPYNFKNGDKIKVTKTLFELTSTNDTKKIVELEKIVDAVAKENNSPQEVGEIKVRLKQAFNDNDSMGNGALTPLAELEKNGDDIYATVTFSPLFIKAFNATGNVTKIAIYPTLEDMKNNINLQNAEVVETYDNGNPKKVRIKLKDNEKYIGVRVWVDMMDEIARNSGQKDGSQPAVLEFDWSTKKLITKEISSSNDTIQTPENKETSSPNNEENADKIVKENIPTKEGINKSDAGTTLPSILETIFENNAKQASQLEKGDLLPIISNSNIVNLGSGEGENAEQLTTNNMSSQAISNSNQQIKTLAKTGIKSTSFAVLGLSLVGVALLLRRKIK